MTGTTRFLLTVEAGPGEVPGVVRLRALLKLMWRGFRMRAIEMRELSPDPELEASEDAEQWQKGGDLEPEEREAVRSVVVINDRYDQIGNETGVCP